MKSVCEYLLFIEETPKFIMYARVRTKYEDALYILNKHMGHTLARENITLKLKSQVSKKLWETFVTKQHGGRWEELQKNEICLC